MGRWVALALLASTAAMADDKPVPPDPTMTMTVTLTLGQWREIAASVQRSPIMTAQEAAGLNDAIGQQLDAELKAKQAKPKK